MFLGTCRGRVAVCVPGTLLLSQSVPEQNVDGRVSIQNSTSSRGSCKRVLWVTSTMSLALTVPVQSLGKVGFNQPTVSSSTTAVGLEAAAPKDPHIQPKKPLCLIDRGSGRRPMWAAALAGKTFWMHGRGKSFFLDKGVRV